MSSEIKVRYYAQIMLMGYKDLPRVKLRARTDSGALNAAWKISKNTPNSISYSVIKQTEQYVLPEK